MTAPEPITVSYSEIDTLRQCLFKHELTYKERWTKGAAKEGSALAKGTLWHQVMQAHYTIIQRWQVEQDEAKAAGGKVRSIRSVEGSEVLAKQIKEAVDPLLYDQRSGKQTDDQALIEWMYLGYVQHYGLDPNWKVLAVEHPILTPLPNEAGSNSRFLLKGKIDLVIMEYDTRNVYVIDHKSGKDLPSDKMLDIDDQFSLYDWAMRQLGKPPFGLLHNAVRTQRNVSKEQTLESRHHRTRLVRTNQELDAVALDAYRAVRHAYSIPEGQAPRSPHPDTCRWRCDVSEACMLGRKGRDTRQVLSVTGFKQDFTRH